MNHESASTLKNEIFKEQKISFADIPHQTKLFVDFQKNAEKINKFFPSKNKKLKEFSGEVLVNYKTDRQKLCDMLFVENQQYQVGKKTFANIEKLRQADCVAVLTGQQAGLFSGSGYTIYKALSAIKLADELTKQGIKAVPIFWIASEDHDFEEISKTFFIDAENKISEVINKPANISDSSPIGFIKLDETIDESIKTFIESLPKTEFTPQIKNLLTETYKRGESFSVAFGRLLAKIFIDNGLIFISPLNKKFRELCSPIYKSAIENSEIITNKLLQRNDELTSENYHSQVLVQEDFFPFFYIDENQKRNSLKFDKKTGKIKSQDSALEFSIKDLTELARNSPESLSPNALMRPVVQDYLFPTICYFGGGAEIAYFAQNSVIYETLNCPATPIRHRSSFTIIQGRHRRNLDKYDLNFADLFRGKETILAGIVEKYINPETSQTFKSTLENVNKQLDILSKDLIHDEPTLADNLANRRQKIEWHLETLQNKFYRAETLKNDVINKRIESLFAEVLPENVLQERTINTLYFLNIFGEHFVEWLYKVVNPEETDHQIIIF